MPIVEGCKHEIEITIPAAEMEQETVRVAEKYRLRAHLPGFRPGKAPLSMIQSRFASDIRQEALEALLPRFFRQQMDADKMDVVGNPSITDIHYHPGEDIKFKAEFEVAPTIELGEYRGVAVTYAAPTVSDEDVNERLEALRNQKADFVNLDPRPAEMGDVALIDLHSTEALEGEPVHAHDMQIELGNPDTLADFTTHLVGMTPGEEKVFSVSYPEEYGQERFAGKTVEFRATFKTLQRKDLPELNDEFAKDLGDFQTMDELRDVIRRNTLAEREHTAQRAAKDAIVDKLVDAHTFPVPEAYIDRQVESYIERQLSDLAQRGVDVKKIKVDPAKVKEATRERATREIKASLLLARIAEREAINATQDEVDQELNRFARQNREPVAAVRKRFQENGTLDRIAHAIQTEKVLNLLFEQARKE